MLFRELVDAFGGKRAAPVPGDEHDEGVAAGRHEGSVLLRAAVDRAEGVRAAVDRQVQHAKYKKFIRARNTFKVHDEKNECKIGDRVRIEETRPLSRDKRWRLKVVLERAKV